MAAASVAEHTGRVTRTLAREVDVLEVGRTGPSCRTVLVAVVPLVLVLLAVVLVDQRARAAENARLDTCATRTHAAVQEATARMAGILNYTKPVWDYRIPPRVKRSLDAMVSRSARRAELPVERARRSCDAVQVGSLHTGLRDRQAACLQLLDTFAGFMRGVAADAGVASGEWPEDVASGC